MNPNQTETEADTIPMEPDAYEMEAPDHDDGLVHNHDWAASSYGR